MPARRAVKWLLLCACAFVVGPPSGLAAGQDVSTAQLSPELRDAAPDASGWGVAAGLRYLEILHGGASPQQKLPLLLVLHGRGDKPGHDWLQVLDLEPAVQARIILPQAPLPLGDGFSWFAQRGADLDHTPLARSISAQAQRLGELLQVLEKQRPTRGRAVVTGFSQGGMLSYALSLLHPQRVARALPIGGMLPQAIWPAQLPPQPLPPLHALHGTADAVIRFDLDERLHAHLRELGYPAELTRFEGVGHSITPAMTAILRRELSAALSQPSAAGARGPSKSARERPGSSSATPSRPSASDRPPERSPAPQPSAASTRAPEKPARERPGQPSAAP
jgi:phospholipase/carboxylesterase